MNFIPDLLAHADPPVVRPGNGAHDAEGGETEIWAGNEVRNAPGSLGPSRRRNRRDAAPPIRTDGRRSALGRRWRDDQGGQIGLFGQAPGETADHALLPDAFAEEIGRAHV